MPQLHLYVPADVATSVRRRAAMQGVSVSQFLAKLVKREVAQGWPEGFFEDVNSNETEGGQNDDRLNPLLFDVPAGMLVAKAPPAPQPKADTPKAQPPGDLVAHYDFDDDEGTDALDRITSEATDDASEGAETERQTPKHPALPIALCFGETACDERSETFLPHRARHLW